MEPTEKPACCCCGTAAQPEEAVSPAVPVEEPVEEPSGCCCRHKDRTPAEHKALLNRLSRIEGQVAAANSALNSFSKELLAQHIGTCVAEDLRAGSNEKLDELIKLLPKLMK